MKINSPSTKFFGAYLIWLLLFALVLWFVPKPWNFGLGVLFTIALFALPGWIKGSYSGSFLKNESERFDWAKIQFVAWYSVIIGGLLAFGAIRLKGGIINPLNVVVDGTVALLLGTSALVFLTRELSSGARKQVAKDVELPSQVFFHTVFLFLTFVFVLSQTYLLWTTLKITIPALLANYPTISWGFALIYLVAGIAVSIIDLLTRER